MNLLPNLFQTLRSDPWRALPCAAIAVGGLASLRLPAATHGQASLFLLQAAAFVMLFQAGSVATRLVQTAQVLAQRRIPDAVWTGQITQCLAGVGAAGAALLAALAVQWGLGGGTRAMALTGAAALSLSACAGTLFPFLRSGLLLRLSKRAVNMAALAFLLALMFYGHQLLGAAAGWPAPMLLALVMCWPMTALALRRHWRSAPSSPARAQAEQAQPPAWVSALSRRVYLHPIQRGGVWKNGAVGSLQVCMATLAAGMRENVALGDALTASHLLSLIGFLPLAIMTVSMRDLHWRFLLLPGGVTRGSLAFRIYGATLKFAAITLLSVCLGVTLSDYLLLGKSVTAIQAGLDRWAIIAMDVPLLIAVAVLVMAIPHPHMTLWSGFIAALAVYVASLTAKLQTVRFESLHTGPAYGAAMLLLAGLVMLVADRVWTPRQLLPYLPERPAGAAFNAAR